MSTIIRRFLSYIGKCKPSDFKNPAHGTLVDLLQRPRETSISPLPYYHYIQGLLTAVPQDPRIKYASIEGTELHKSHKDPTDTQKVISIRFFDEDKKRVGTGHLHEDGTDKFRYKKKPPSESPSGGFEGR
ncbi:hypothetical protein ASPCAL06634 [Aspergillus calidoustus]|uniref:Uncharacterized protein n=1 Tax=Aspergillus calidoustus TaxID=454130 RepID=A0A0U5C987_ASPCI|nr:hypothetical protein ASPCAL06634 [Aspergillus calidoustus]